MKYLDPSIVIEAMNPDSEDNFSCKEILIAVESGREQVIVSCFIFTEIFFVLDRNGLSKDKIEKKLLAFLKLKGLTVVVYDPFLLSNAFILASRYKIDLIDATNKQLMDAFQIKEIYSLDPHFDRFKGIQRLTQLSSKN